MLYLRSQFAYVMHVDIVITGCGLQVLHYCCLVAMVDCLMVSSVLVLQMCRL